MDDLTVKEDKLIAYLDYRPPHKNISQKYADAIHEADNDYFRVKNGKASNKNSKKEEKQRGFKNIEDFCKFAKC